MSEYLKIPEVARRLDVSEKTARRYIRSGELPSAFIGGAYRVSEEDLASYQKGAIVKPEELTARPKEEPPLPLETETNERERRLEEQIEGIPKTLKSYLQGRIEEHGQELKDPDSLHFRTPESASLWAEMVSREGQMWTAWAHDNRDALVPPHNEKSFGDVLLSVFLYSGDLVGHSILTFRELVRRAEKRIAAMEGPVDELAARRMKDATAALEDAQRRDKEMHSASG